MLLFTGATPRKQQQTPYLGADTFGGDYMGKKLRSVLGRDGGHVDEMISVLSADKNVRNFKISDIRLR